ncbi:MAG: hypothetical protein NFCOHLIN_03042 [Gammaproteobacteria bacterium]|nr:hypothetical protein [Gammaproteobacteria bacterium]
MLLSGVRGALAADYREIIGYRRLVEVLGIYVPNGRGVRIAQVEAPLLSRPGLWQFAAAGAWRPDIDDGDFAGKRLHLSTATGEGGISGHATAVGRLLYGASGSMASAATDIDVYSATNWMRDVLRTGSMFFPAQMSARVVNHSWVGSTGSPVYDSEVLRRLDWSVNADRNLHVVGIGNGNPSPPLLGNAFNVISVGRSDGRHGSGTAEIDSVYREERTMPLLVAPMDTTSAATPVVAAAAAALVQTAQRWATFSRNTVRTLDGAALPDGARPEVIKALLMAGANREFRAGNGASDYRRELVRRSANGLDRIYGAGQLNVLNSYAILSGGEQRSAEDDRRRGGIIKPYGYDFDDAFGGEAGSNEVANYHFRADRRHRWLTATLAWNVRISTDSAAAFAGVPELVDLDLELFDDTEARRVAVSASWAENTETIRLELTPGHDYRIVVRLGDGEETFLWRYALAWRRDAGG